MDAGILAWNDGGYGFTAGYWGPTAGFYGGIDYGFGYNSFGYWGGRWDHGRFDYNRAVNKFGGVHITSVYNHTVINNTVSRVSFNGGAGGVAARPTAAQEPFARQNHVPPTAAQTAHIAAARGDRSLLATQNHGRPPVAATARPGELHGAGAVASRDAGPANAAAARPQADARPAAPQVHAAAPRPQQQKRPQG
jgi:hypothetical protein